MLRDSDTQQLLFSPQACSALMLLALFLNGLRKYPACLRAMPSMATDSAGISTACHRPEADKDAYLYPIRLAATDGGLGDGTKVLCFSTDTQAERPQNETVYWLPVAPEKGTREQCRFFLPMAWQTRFHRPQIMSRIRRLWSSIEKLNGSKTQ